MSQPASCTHNNVKFNSLIFIERIGQDCRCDLGLRVFCLHVSLPPVMPGLPLLSDPSCLYLPFPSSSDVSPHSMGCTEGPEDNRKQPPSRTVFDICPATYLFGLTFKLWLFLTNHLQRLLPCHLCNNTAYNSEIIHTLTSFSSNIAHELLRICLLAFLKLYGHSN